MHLAKGIQIVGFDTSKKTGFWQQIYCLEALPSHKMSSFEVVILLRR